MVFLHGKCTPSARRPIPDLPVYVGRHYLRILHYYYYYYNCKGLFQNERCLTCQTLLKNCHIVHVIVQSDSSIAYFLDIIGDDDEGVKFASREEH